MYLNLKSEVCEVIGGNFLESGERTQTLES